RSRGSPEVCREGDSAMTCRIRLLLLTAALGLALWFWPVPRTPFDSLVVIVPVEEYDEGDGASFEYQQVDEAEADIVLVVRYGRPGWELGEPSRYPYRRNPGAVNREVQPLWHTAVGCGGRGGGHTSVNISSVDVMNGTPAP